MNLKPLNDRVIIKAKEAVEKTKGGIILPDTASKEKPVEGVVVAVGPGKMAEDGKRVALTVKANAFSKTAQEKIEKAGGKVEVI